MQRLLHLLLTLVVLLGMTSLDLSAGAQAEDILDLADVPLPVQDLPEAGYQVLSGGYLNMDETAALIASPRNLNEAEIFPWFEEVRLTRTYVLDLVLPEDRAWQDSPFLAVLQTSVYHFEDERGAEEFSGFLQNYANTAFVDELNPAVNGAYTIAMTGEAGDQIRTVVASDRVVIEIVSMDATGVPDATEHLMIVEATLERLNQLREFGDIGLSPMALTLARGENTASYGHAQQTGVHGVYRYRDGTIQPAIGEMTDDGQAIAPGMTSLYISSGIGRVGGGNAIVSTWLGSFDSSESASFFFDVMISGFPGSVLIDPYFSISDEEVWTEQGVLGLYRVSGFYNGEVYSGEVEIRQLDTMVVAIGYRAIGATLPAANITNSIMDNQLDCLEVQIVCPPYELEAAPATLQATPVASIRTGALGSSEFGWSLPPLGPEWIVDDQFSDPGYDRIGLRNGVSIFEMESVINHHGDPRKCVLDELHMLEALEEHSVITVWEDAAGNTEGGTTVDQAWIVYRVEPLDEERADQEYVIRIDCFSLMSGAANLVVKHIAPVDFWVDEQSKGDLLREMIVFPESFKPHGKLGVSAHDRRMTMISFHDSHRAA